MCQSSLLQEKKIDRNELINQDVVFHRDTSLLLEKNRQKSCFFFLAIHSPA